MADVQKQLRGATVTPTGKPSVMSDGAFREAAPALARGVAGEQADGGVHRRRSVCDLLL